MKKHIQQALRNMKQNINETSIYFLAMGLGTAAILLLSSLAEFIGELL